MLEVARRCAHTRTAGRYNHLWGVLGHRHYERIVPNKIGAYAFSFFFGRSPEWHQTRSPPDVAVPAGGRT